MIFVDSSAWFAIYSRRDANNTRAWQILQSLREELVTSDFVIDETLTLLQMRDQHRHAVAFGRRLIEGDAARVIKIDEADFHAAWLMFQQYHDKEWSFTDCTSFVVMERLGITRAFAFDDHFRQFGKVSVIR